MRYSQADGKYWLVVDVDKGIVDLARSLVPKYYKLNKTRYEPHITVVRNEVPSNIDYWRAHSGEIIAFDYSPIVKNDEIYWWLDVMCPRLTDIRTELGLDSTSKWSRPPDGLEVFHITIGNTKNG